MECADSTFTSIASSFAEISHLKSLRWNCKMPRAFLVKQKTEKFKKMPSNLVVSSPGNGKHFAIVFVHLL